MVGGTMFHRRVIQREISRVLVLNLSGKTSGAKNTDRIFLSLTPPSLLSRGTRQEAGSSSPLAIRSAPVGMTENGKAPGLRSERQKIESPCATREESRQRRRRTGRFLRHLN